MEHIQIYTDGACKGNPGPGGWGVFLVSKQHNKELYGGERQTTNNQMELRAVIEALLAIKKPCYITLYLDSEYVRKGVTEWLPQWKSRNWKTASKKPVKNKELWQQLDHILATQKHGITWRWVKGHSGNEGNEKADHLANKGIPQM